MILFSEMAFAFLINDRLRLRNSFFVFGLKENLLSLG